MILYQRLPSSASNGERAKIGSVDPGAKLGGKVLDVAPGMAA